MARNKNETLVSELYIVFKSKLPSENPSFCIFCTFLFLCFLVLVSDNVNDNSMAGCWAAGISLFKCC